MRVLFIFVQGERDFRQFEDLIHFNITEIQATLLMREKITKIRVNWFDFDFCYLRARIRCLIVRPSRRSECVFHPSRVR